MSAFGSAASRLPVELASEARKKIAHGDRHRKQLEASMLNWWGEGDSHPIEIVTRNRGTFVDIYFVTEDVPPVDDWRIDAHVVIHDYRTALDNFHHAVHRHFGGRIDAHTYFPIFDQEVKWSKDWVRNNKLLPPDLVERYRSVQPFAVEHPRLLHLRELDDLEKHPGLVAAAVSMVEASMQFSSTLEGIYRDGPRSETWDAFGPIDVAAPETLVSSIDLHLPVLETAELESQLRFDPELRGGGEAVPLLRALQLFHEDVENAIKTVLG